MKVSISSTSYNQTPEWLQSDHKINIRGGVTIDSDLVLPDPITLRRVVLAGTPVGYLAANDRWGPYTPDILITGDVENNNAIRWTSLKPGTTVRIAIVDPGQASQALGVSVVGDTVEVSVETDGASAVVSTAADVIAAVNAHLVAREIVLASSEGESDGTGVVAAIGSTELSGSNGIVPSAILTEDVDVTTEDIAAGAIVHGVVTEAKLPVAVDAGAKAALRNILFV